MTPEQIDLVRELLSEGRPDAPEPYFYGPLTFDAIEAMLHEVEARER